MRPRTIALRLAAAVLALALAGRAHGAAGGSDPSRHLAEATDITAEYNALFTGAGPGRNAGFPGKLRNYRILFVPGFLSDLSVNSALTAGNFGTGRGTYFNTQILWLAKAGVDSRLVDIESEESVQYNSRKIIESIKASPRPVIIVAHSKGGLDVLEALLAYYEASEKVAGVITIQSPFLGTPVSDSVLKQRIFSALLWTAFSVLGGSEMSMLDLSVDIRGKYHRDNAQAIAELTALTPFVCFGSRVVREGPPVNTKLVRFWDFLLKLGLENDGLVPLQSTILPGSYGIAAEGPDHSATVKDDGRSFDRTGFLRTLLELLSARMPEPEIK